MCIKSLLIEKRGNSLYRIMRMTLFRLLFSFAAISLVLYSFVFDYNEEPEYLPNESLVTKSPHYTIFYAIYCRPDEREVRQQLRKNGFLAYLNRNARPDSDKSIYKFVVANGQNATQILGQEQAEFGDILLLDSFYDSYRTLVKKTAKLLEWAAFQQEFTFDYLAKVDNDVFVNPAVLGERVKLMPKYSILGEIHTTSVVQRSPDSKYYEPSYPLSTYMPFPNGPSYVLTAPLVQRLGNDERLGYLQHFANEDTSLGSWVAFRNVTLINVGMNEVDCKPEMISFNFWGLSDANMNKHFEMAKNAFYCSNPCNCP
jgi:hypothetical protein